MTKQEVLEKMAQNNLFKVKCKDNTIEYVEGKQIYTNNTFHNRINSFGVYFSDRSNKYEFFVTGEDLGGVIRYHKGYDNENAAFTAMYEYIERKNRIFSKNE